MSSERLSKDSKYYESVHTEEVLHRFSEGLYAARNEILIDHLSSVLPEQSHVLDLAAGSCYIAKRLVEDGRVASYTWNDFNPNLIKLVEKEVLNDKFLIDPFDADDAECDLGKFNVFICISLEHIEKDLEILSKLKPGTIVSICSPNFDSKEHVRHFESIDEFKSRYAHLIEAHQETVFKCKKVLEKYVLTGVRR